MYMYITYCMSIYYSNNMGMAMSGRRLLRWLTQSPISSTKHMKLLGPIIKQDGHHQYVQLPL